MSRNTASIAKRSEDASLSLCAVCYDAAPEPLPCACKRPTVCRSCAVKTCRRQVEAKCPCCRAIFPPGAFGLHHQRVRRNPSSSYSEGSEDFEPDESSSSSSSSADEADEDGSSLSEHDASDQLIEYSAGLIVEGRLRSLPGRGNAAAPGFPIPPLSAEAGLRQPPGAEEIRLRAESLTVTALHRRGADKRVLLAYVELHNLETPVVSSYESLRGLVKDHLQHGEREWPTDPPLRAKRKGDEPPHETKRQRANPVAALQRLWLALGDHLLQHEGDKFDREAVAKLLEALCALDGTPMTQFAMADGETAFNIGLTFLRDSVTLEEILGAHYVATKQPAALAKIDAELLRRLAQRPLFQ